LPPVRDRFWFFESDIDGTGRVHAVTDVLYSGTTRYQSVQILATRCFGKILVLDGDIQSAQLDEYIYHEALVHPGLVLHPQPRRVLILGGGEGCTLREVLRHNTVQRVVQVDIDGELIELCRRYLPEMGCNEALSDPRTELVVGDGYAYVNQGGDGFDVIISDLTAPADDSPSRHLFTSDFYRMLESRLNPGGIFVSQAGATDLHLNLLHTRIVDATRRVFPIVRSFSAGIPSFGNEWGFVIASAKLDPQELEVVEIDQRLAGRVEGNLRFYDGTTHRRLFSLPLGLRRSLSREGAPLA